MSRSLKKTPIAGITKAESDKEFKKIKAKKRRRSADPVEKKDWWGSSKDGKRWFGGSKNESKYRRK